MKSGWLRSGDGQNLHLSLSISEVAVISGRVDFLRWPSLARTLKRRAEARIFYLLGSAFAFLSL